MDITVITPFYKGNQYMRRLFQCVCANAQAAPELKIELVLVNDSPDCPIAYEPEWVRGFFLQIHNNPVNVGIQRSRVNGLDLAKGEFVVFLDQDDYLADYALLSQFRLAGDCDVVLANGYNENIKKNVPIYKNLAEHKTAAEPRFYYSVSNLIASPGQCLIRRTAIPEIWKEQCISRNGSDDLLLWLLLFRSGAQWKINPDCLYTHVDTGENLSNDVKKMVNSSLEALNVLKKNDLITPREERAFLRGRKMAAQYINGSKIQKILAILRYPDVAMERLLLSVRQR